jgi:hypothetical protein
MIYVFVGLLLWTVYSFWYFMNVADYKCREERWYDFFLLAPIVVIATIAGWISTLFGWNK